MSELVRFVFSDSGLVVSVLVAAIWVARRPQAKAARRFLLFVALFYTLISIHAVSFVLTRPLIAGYHPVTAADVPPGPTAVVVLGFGSYSIQDWNGNEHSGPDVSLASRVLEAVRVYKMIDPHVVVASGGKRRADQYDEATGVVIRDLLVQLGVPADRITVQLKPRDTAEEARFNTELLRSAGIDHIVVVTSDFHMRRSVGAFRAQGVRIIPAIARDPMPARSWQDWIVPGDAGLWHSATLAHEVLGIGYYAARGWMRF